jgi:hypothetical protein
LSAIPDSFRFSCRHRIAIHPRPSLGLQFLHAVVDAVCFPLYRLAICLPSDVCPTATKRRFGDSILWPLQGRVIETKFGEVDVPRGVHWKTETLGLKRNVWTDVCVCVCMYWSKNDPRTLPRLQLVDHKSLADAGDGTTNTYPFSRLRKDHMEKTYLVSVRGTCWQKDSRQHTLQNSPFEPPNERQTTSKHAIAKHHSVVRVSAKRRIFLSLARSLQRCVAFLFNVYNQSWMRNLRRDSSSHVTGHSLQKKPPSMTTPTHRLFFRCKCDCSTHPLSWHPETGEGVRVSQFGSEELDDLTSRSERAQLVVAIMVWRAVVIMVTGRHWIQCAVW